MQTFRLVKGANSPNFFFFIHAVIWAQPRTISELPELSTYDGVGRFAFEIEVNAEGFEKLVPFLNIPGISDQATAQEKAQFLLVKSSPRADEKDLISEVSVKSDASAEIKELFARTRFTRDGGDLFEISTKGTYSTTDEYFRDLDFLTKLLGIEEKIQEPLNPRIKSVWFSHHTNQSSNEALANNPNVEDQLEGLNLLKVLEYAHVDQAVSAVGPARSADSSRYQAEIHDDGLIHKQRPREEKSNWFETRRTVLNPRDELRRNMFLISAPKQDAMRYLEHNIKELMTEENLMRILDERKTRPVENLLEYVADHFTERPKIAEEVFTRILDLSSEDYLEWGFSAKFPKKVERFESLLPYYSQMGESNQRRLKSIFLNAVDSFPSVATNMKLVLNFLKEHLNEFSEEEKVKIAKKLGNDDYAYFYHDEIVELLKEESTLIRKSYKQNYVTTQLKKQQALEADARSLDQEAKKYKISLKQALLSIIRAFANTCKKLPIGNH